MFSHSYVVKKPTMAKSSPRDRSLWIVFVGAILVFCALWTFNPWPSFSTLLPKPTAKAACTQLGTGQPQAMINNISKLQDPIHKTFYDDPSVSYTLEKPMINWDEKREKWLTHHPALRTKDRLMVVSASQPWPCKNPIGDHFMLRFFKNKIDYCRIHGYEIFYNTALFDNKMYGYWAKIPAIKAVMMTHPEVEWIFWVDSDAIFTDMDFKVPLEKYKDHNFVVHGWLNLIYEDKSWLGVNAGIFLIRNCQWSMDFMDVWADMGPRSPNYQKWSRVLRTTLSDKAFPDSDDQSSLVYLLLKEKEKWGKKIYVENKYSLHGYWLGIVPKFDEWAKKYEEIENRHRRLRRRHAEAVTQQYAAERDLHVTEEAGERPRPFITHFTGCQPCSGEYNPNYKGNSCVVGMERAINFADNQVLRTFGFVHQDLEYGTYLRPLPFDYPREGRLDKTV